MEAMVKQMTVVGEKLASRQTVKDNFQIVCEYVASKMRRWKEKQYALILADAKHKITSALHEAEICKNYNGHNYFRLLFKPRNT